MTCFSTTTHLSALWNIFFAEHEHESSFVGEGTFCTIKPYILRNGCWKLTCNRWNPSMSNPLNRDISWWNWKHSKRFVYALCHKIRECKQTNPGKMVGIHHLCVWLKSVAPPKRIIEISRRDSSHFNEPKPPKCWSIYVCVSRCVVLLWPKIHGFCSFRRYLDSIFADPKNSDSFQFSSQNQLKSHDFCRCFFCWIPQEVLRFHPRLEVFGWLPASRRFMFFFENGDI